MENKLQIMRSLESSNKYFEDFISRSTYHSNAIEGSALSYAETYALLFDRKYCKIEKADVKDIHEAINHKCALNLVIDRIKKKIFHIDEGFLTIISQTINKNILYVDGYRLGWVQVHGSKKLYPRPQELDKLMNVFYEKYNKSFFLKADISDIAKMFLDFENIHPYINKNCSIGNLLINYILLLNNQAPIVIPFESRAYYLQMIEDDNVEGLTYFFRELQDSEQSRINDFLEMENEEALQIKFKSIFVSRHSGI